MQLRHPRHLTPISKAAVPLPWCLAGDTVASLYLHYHDLPSQPPVCETVEATDQASNFLFSARGLGVTDGYRFTCLLRCQLPAEQGCGAGAGAGAGMSKFRLRVS
jgi:hypothetical protein